MSAVGARVDEVDVQIEKLQRLIDRAATKDPELAAGLATEESLSAIERQINQACAACEDLEHHLRDVIRNRKRGRA